MAPNNEGAQEKKEIGKEIKRANDLIKYLQQFADVTKSPDPIIRKPIIDKIWDLVKEIQEYAKKLGKFEKDAMG